MSDPGPRRLSIYRCFCKKIAQMLTDHLNTLRRETLTFHTDEIMKHSHKRWIVSNGS